jgi:Skp family chaperone for outer membrane proteins
MRAFRLLISSFALTLVFMALAIAQTEKTQTVPQVKIAVINTDAFYDKETGIKEVVETDNKLEAEFKPQFEELKLMAEKIVKLEKELKILGSGYWDGPITKEDIEKLISDYESAVSKYKTRQNEIKSLYEKRKPEIFADVYKEVGAAIKQFSTENGYLIIDISKSYSSFIITDVDEDEDVTKEFIKYYNEIFAKSKSQ